MHQFADICLAIFAVIGCFLLIIQTRRIGLLQEQLEQSQQKWPPLSDAEIAEGVAWAELGLAAAEWPPDAEIAEGVAMAELGLAADVAEWPPY